MFTDRSLPFRTSVLLLVTGATACRSDAGDAGRDTPSADSVLAEAERRTTPAGHLAVDGDGLRVFLEPSGAARPLPFGRPLGEVLAVATPLLGGRTPVLTERPDCGATAAEWKPDGLTLWFAISSAPRLVGWSLHSAGGPDGARHVATASGIRPGVTRAAVESVYVTTVRRSTLGAEFTIGEMAGLLSGPEPTARVTHLWAGQVCLGR